MSVTCERGERHWMFVGMGGVLHSIAQGFALETLTKLTVLSLNEQCSI